MFASIVRIRHFCGACSIGLVLTAMLMSLTVTSLSAEESAKTAITPFGPADLAKIKGINQLSLSPDGQFLAYVLNTPDFEENKGKKNIYMVNTVTGVTKALTSVLTKDSAPLWAPDGKSLAFLSNRKDGQNQIFVLPLDVGEARQVSDFPGDIEDFSWTPDGRSMIFVAEVYPDCNSLKCSKERDDAKEKNKVKARVHERLLYRHWDSYDEGKVQHLFRLKLDDGTIQDITPKLKFHALTFWMASAGREYEIAPDGSYLYFAGNQDDNQAVSYNTEIFRIRLDQPAEVEKLTSNPAADNQPRLSPDGKFLAYRMTRRPGYESDRYEIAVMDLASKNIRYLSEKIDLSVGAMFWGADGREIFFSAEDRGDINLFGISLDSATLRPVIGRDAPGGHGYHLDTIQSRDGSFFVYRYRPMQHPFELYRYTVKNGEVKKLSAINDELLKKTYVPDAEEIWFDGADGTKIQGFLSRPINFDPSKKYPMMVRIHGGPQQALGYSFRKEYILFANAGYVVFWCNPRGSTGYGQKFCDDIRGDYDGKVFDDLRRGVQYVSAKYSFVDPRKIAGWGDSFGGWMANWIEGHNDDGLFAVLVSHAGIADEWSAYGTTEELWFPEWDLRGTPWDNPDQYNQESPIRFAKNFHTPMLITHGELDYRVSISGADVMFTALQRLNVPSKYIRFPDEGHWILKPQNEKFWLGSILDWCDQWLKRDGKVAPAPDSSEKKDSPAQK
jgi:dipeptidyl aminopeptidase/acylaminoacyl peptidase